jgi:D-alanyl-D-alanine carboxypeptidase
VTRGTSHVIAVVMGGRTAVRRDMEMVRLLDQTFGQIAANPMLVARATVPWQQVAQTAPAAPAIAGFSLPQVATNKFASIAPVPKTVQTDDEDAAEAVRAPDENFSVIHAETPKPAAQQPAPQVAKPVPQPAKPLPAVAAAPTPAMVKLAGPVPAVRPSARPEMTAAPSAVRVAVNAPRPQMRPSVHEEAGEGDADPSPGHNWTIQIGAYADKALADAQLKTYAGKAQDVLARASRIIAPITSAQGHTLYRARFGLFAEQEARDVCNQLTQRGQTCFAAVQSR